MKSGFKGCQMVRFWRVGRNEGGIDERGAGMVPILRASESLHLAYLSVPFHSI